MLMIQIYVPPLKDTASPKTAMCWLWRKQFDTQLVIFYLYSQSVSDIRNTTQIIQLSLFVSSWSLAQPTDDFTRSVVAEKLLFIFLCSVFEPMLNLFLLNISDKIQTPPTKCLHVYLFLYIVSCVLSWLNVSTPPWYRNMKSSFSATTDLVKSSVGCARLQFRNKIFITHAL
jgi:hypothetical protein